MTILETFARQTYAAQEEQRARRDQTAENSARQAFFSAEARTTGAGYFAVKAPVMFDCQFIHKPAFFFGPEMLAMPDSAHYRYPVANAGVYDWVTEPMPDAAASKQKALSDSLRAAGAVTGVGAEAVTAVVNAAMYGPDELIYKGAYIYFTVLCEPVRRPRTDGSDLTSLQTQLAADPTNATLPKLIAEAQEALYLTAHPPQPVMNFSMTWMGVALKTVTDSVVDKLHGQPDAAPTVPTSVVARGA